MKFNSLVETILEENKERSQDEMRKDFESLYTMFEGLPRGVKQAQDMGWKITSNEYQKKYICEDPSSKDTLTTDKDSYDIETFKDGGRFIFRYNGTNVSPFFPKFEIISDTPLKLSSKPTGNRLFHMIEHLENGNSYREQWATKIDNETEYYKEYPWWLQNKEKSEKIGIDISPVSKEEEEF
jgi:hypothetical protein